ncbi:UPF0739 protein C1orf74 homolog [Discoglossus pictus]
MAATLHGRLYSAAIKHLKEKKKKSSLSLSVSLSLAAEVLAVDSGLKPCFLYDYSAAGEPQIQSYLEELQHMGVLQGHLHILNIEGTFLIINVHRTISHLDKLLQSGDLYIIDVSAHLNQPVMCGKNQLPQIHAQLQMLLQHLVQYHSAQAATVSVGQIHAPDWNLCTIYGFLLGFPATYWFDTTRSFENCLSLIPLKHFTVQASCARIGLHKVHIYSFTVPEFVYHSLQAHLDDWGERLKQMFNGQNSFTDLQIITDTVTLTAVPL